MRNSVLSNRSNARNTPNTLHLNQYIIEGIHVGIYVQSCSICNLLQLVLLYVEIVLLKISDIQQKETLLCPNSSVSVLLIKAKKMTRWIINRKVYCLLALSDILQHPSEVFCSNRMSKCLSKSFNVFTNFMLLSYVLHDFSWAVETKEKQDVRMWCAKM